MVRPYGRTKLIGGKKYHERGRFYSKKSAVALADSYRKQGNNVRVLTVHTVRDGTYYELFVR